MPDTEEEWRKIAKDFEERWQFPNCLGAIDGKHIRIIPPPGSGSYFWNYKNFNSIGLVQTPTKNLYGVKLVQMVEFQMEEPYRIQFFMKNY